MPSVFSKKLAVLKDSKKKNNPGKNHQYLDKRLNFILSLCKFITRNIDKKNTRNIIGEDINLIVLE